MDCVHFYATTKSIFKSFFTELVPRGTTVASLNSHTQGCCPACEVPRPKTLYKTISDPSANASEHAFRAPTAQQFNQAPAGSTKENDVLGSPFLVKLPFTTSTAVPRSVARKGTTNCVRACWKFHDTISWSRRAVNSILQERWCRRGCNRDRSALLGGSDNGMDAAHGCENVTIATICDRIANTHSLNSYIPFLDAW